MAKTTTKRKRSQTAKKSKQEEGFRAFLTKIKRARIIIKLLSELWDWLKEVNWPDIF